MSRFINANAISEYAWPLTTAALAKEGEIAVGDTTTGKVLPAGILATAIPLGFFMVDATGDGTAKVMVRLFEEVWGYICTNDATTPVARAFQTVYTQDGKSVSLLSTANSIAGLALEVTAAGVLVVFRRLGAA